MRERAMRKSAEGEFELELGGGGLGRLEGGDKGEAVEKPKDFADEEQDCSSDKIEDTLDVSYA